MAGQTAVMTKTIVEWIPLHSGATTNEKPGKFSTRSSRKTDIPAALKKPAAVAADVCWKNSSVALQHRRRHRNHERQKPRGNVIARVKAAPKTPKEPAARKQQIGAVITVK